MTNEELLATHENKCFDCGAATTPGELTPHPDGYIKSMMPGTCEHYMVTKRVWAKAGMQEDGGSLCIGCLEKRLGRRLKRNDFTFHIEGYFHFATPRLLDRLR